MSGQRIVVGILAAALVTISLTPCLAGQPATETVQPAAAAPPMLPLTAAFVDRSGSKLGALLESALFERSNVSWVERTEIKKILAEQALDRAFGSVDIDARLKLGKLLTAEVLVLLREIPATGNLPTRYELAVCETRRGLRLGAKVYALPSDGLQQLQATMLADIQRAFAKQREQITRLVAVSPLLNDSLTRRDDALQKALATLLEETLTEIPGLLVVELQEARAIATEKALTSDVPVAQSLVPHFIQGKFRFANNLSDRRAVVELELRQGTKTLTEAKSEPLAPADIPAWLRTTSQAFTEKMGLPKNAAPHDRKLEIEQLNARARDFTKLRNWSEAVTLAEASLLLDPRQRDMHLTALYAYGNIHPEGARSIPEFTTKQCLESWAMYEIALDHFEQYQELSDEPINGKTEYGPFAETMFEYKVRSVNMKKLSAEAKQEYDALQERRRETYWRILDSRVKRDLPDGGNFCISLLNNTATYEERCNLLSEIMERLARSGKFAKQNHHYLLGLQLPYKDPAVQAFYERSAKSEHEEIRKLVAAVQKRWTPPPDYKPAPLVTDNPDRPDGPEINDIELIALDWPAAEHRAIGATSYFNNRGVCIPLDDGRDLYCAKNRLLVMAKQGEFETLFTIPSRSRLGELNDRISEMTFDGNYVWTVINERPGSKDRLFAIDIKTKNAVEFHEEHGFVSQDKSDSQHFVALAPLSPGKVVIAADIGRDWYGIGTIAADGKRNIEIIHEGKDRPIRTATPEQTLSMALRPRQAYALNPAAGSKAKPQVLVMRVGDHIFPAPPWVVVDPEAKKVSILDAKFRLRQDFGWAALPIGDKLWFETREPDGKSQFTYGAAISSLSVEDLSKKTDHAQPHGTAYFAANRDEIHTVGNAYQIYSLKDNSFRTVLAPVPWHFLDPYRVNKNMAHTSRTKPNLAGVFYTNHYGFVVVTADASSSAKKTFYQVRVKPAAKTEAATKSPAKE